MLIMAGRNKKQWAYLGGTLPETSKSPLNINGWKMILSFWGKFGLIFRDVCCEIQVFFCDISGQITATSHEVKTPNGGLVREIP